MSPARRYLLAMLLICAAYFAVLAATAPAMGYTRDEGYYFKAADQYGAWWDTLFSRRFFDAFGDEEIKARFSYNTEHPALVKLMLGLSHRVFHQWLGVVSPAQGYRLTGFFFAALSLFATFLLGRDLASPRVGLLAALFVACLPRYFYDAHLACFDVPMTATWTLAIWSYWRGLEAPAHQQRRRAIIAGLLFGVALATKLNALFLPALFVIAWMLARRRSGAGLALIQGPSGGLDVRLPAVPWVLVACATLGPLVFFLHWPYIWHDTLLRVGQYIGFHLKHEHYPILYFNEMLVQPPFPTAFAPVMSALTMPAPLVVLSVLGLLAAVPRCFRRSTADLLLVVGALLPIALLAIPGTPIFGGVKHWYNAMPALAVLAARSLFDATDALGRFATRLAPALAAAALLPGLLGTAASHPNGIGFYNELAGGFRGAAELGMQRSFWGGINRPLIPLLGDLPPATQVFFDHMNYDAYLMYRREGLMPATVYFANEAKGAQAATLFEGRENATSEDAAFSSIGTQPSAGVYQDGVTLVQLYRRLR